MRLPHDKLVKVAELNEKIMAYKLGAGLQPSDLLPDDAPEEIKEMVKEKQAIFDEERKLFGIT